jgi:hypothetical protein
LTITGSTSASGSVTVTGPLIVTGSILYTGSFDGKGDGKITGSLSVSGSIKSNTLILNTILDAPPVYSGSKGEMVFVIDSGNYYLYAFLNDSWRSSILE